MPIAKTLLRFSPRSLVTSTMSKRNLSYVMGSIRRLHDLDQMELMEKELVPVVNIKDQVVELRTKKDCHLMTNIDKGLLHRAFSVLMFNSKKEFLLTQRADGKITFPGYYTNACCSHPAGVEEELDKSEDFIGIRRAAKRRLVFELGVKESDLSLEDIHFMTRFVYKAPSDDPKWGEHELDYVLVINKELAIKPNTNELKYWEYKTKEQLDEFMKKAEAGEVKVSQWFYKIYKLWLNDYWDNLDNLKKFQDRNTIHTQKIIFRGTEL